MAASNVWELLRNGAKRLKGVLRAAPQGAMLLVVGGSPCQQLSVAGPHQGRLGLAGGQSVLFYAIPAIA
eukprot:2072500-Lingulodinium_polyedra.AAC.1